MRKRLRQEAGFGLIELLMAMTILSVGVLALVGAFSAGMFATRRAATLSTAAVLADKQMELYRTLTYGGIALAASSIPTTGPYLSVNDGYSPTQVTTTCATPLPPQCNASRIVDGTTTPASPDRKKYRVDTYIVDEHPAASGRTVRRVTVVVRDGRKLTAVLARLTSTFDCSTALPYASCPTS